MGLHQATVLITADRPLEEMRRPAKCGRGIVNDPRATAPSCWCWNCTFFKLNKHRLNKKMDLYLVQIIKQPFVLLFQVNF